jgi:signal transduction histidine kinase
VFTLFFSSKGTEGTGLGLFIANNIAHAHGGTIAVGSETDKGTTFLVKIPRRRQDGVLNGFAV